jgi:hypothetical protein
MSHDPGEADVRAADKLNLFAASAPLGASVREAAALQMAALERARRTPTQDEIDARWSTFYCEHAYYGTAAACAAAKKIAITNAHIDALREDARRTRQAEGSPEVAA